MRLKASFTVENAFIVPFFTIIIVLMIKIAMTLHDTAIIQNAELQAAMTLDQEERVFEAYEREKCLQQISDYISDKTLIRHKKISEIDQDIKENKIIKSNFQPDFIRSVNAALKLKE